MPARVTALVLAAGRSSRMAPRNKLLIRDATGRTMIGRVVAAALASKAREVVVVTGHQADDIGLAVRRDAGDAARIVRCARFAEGISASLQTGIAAIPDAAAVLVCLGDMPLVTAPMMNALMDAYDPERKKTVIVPTCHGARGNPVLWGNEFFSAFASLAGDTGARALLAQRSSHVLEVEIGSEAVLKDFDTPDALAG